MFLNYLAPQSKVSCITVIWLSLRILKQSCTSLYLDCNSYMESKYGNRKSLEHRYIQTALATRGTEDDITKLVKNLLNNIQL